jgi:hypothetical protein
MKAKAKGSIIISLYINELQTQTHQRHEKYQQGKRRWLGCFEKEKKSHKQSISNKKETRCAISSIVRMCAFSGIDMQYNCYIVMFRIGEP